MLPVDFLSSTFITKTYSIFIKHFFLHMLRWSISYPEQNRRIGQQVLQGLWCWVTYREDLWRDDFCGVGSWDWIGRKRNLQKSQSLANYHSGIDEDLWVLISAMAIGDAKKKSCPDLHDLDDRSGNCGGAGVIVEFWAGWECQENMAHQTN